MNNKDGFLISVWFFWLSLFSPEELTLEVFQNQSRKPPVLASAMVSCNWINKIPRF